MNLTTVSLIALIFVFCVLCQWTAWRVRLPPILFLLLTGIVAGPVLQLVEPDELMGDLLFPFVSLAVAIILFEGSLTLKLREIKGLHIVVRNLVSFGMVITWLITTLAARFFLAISWEVATLFGAIMVVTGPTVVAPILRTVRPVSSIGNILKWESIVIDPIGASLAVLVYEFILIGGWQDALGPTLISFGQLLIIGSAIGCLTGYGFGLCLKYHIVPEYLHNISTLGLVFASFALANAVQTESGLVTVTVFGVWLANMRNVDLEHILAFKETLSILLISLLFIILAARVDFSDLLQLGWRAVAVCLAIQFLARPLCVMISTIGSNLSRQERHFLAWIAPRGIVAAAISSLFALKLQNYGHEDAALLVPLTFMVIIFTVLSQSVTALPIANLLKVSQAEPEGFLIIGSNRLARTIAKALMECDVKVMVTDSSRDRITRAEMEGIPTYHGNPISEHAEYNLQLAGLGSLLALSDRESENIAAIYHYRQEFGKNNTYTLLRNSMAEGEEESSKTRTMSQLRGRTLFGEDTGYTELASILASGGEVCRMTLEEPFNEEHFHAKYGEDAVPLFGIDTKGTPHCFNSEIPPQIEKNWQLIYMAAGKRQNRVPDYS